MRVVRRNEICFEPRNFMLADRTVHFRTAERFLERLRPWQWLGVERRPSWVFRGHGLAESWQLLPGSLRKDRRVGRSVALRRAYDRAARVAASVPWSKWAGAEFIQGQMQALGTMKWFHAACTEAYAHAYVVRQFTHLCERSNKNVTMPSELWHLPNPATAALTSYMLGDAAPPSVFALAQHHLVPTPLLDWSYDPTVAAYFAAEQSMLQRQAEPLCVWALHEDYLNAPHARIRRYSLPPSVTPNRDAQDGLFTWDCGAYVGYGGGDFEPFDVIIRSEASAAGGAVWLRKLTLPSSEAHRLFEMPWAEKKSRAFLMPGYDSVAADLELEASWL